MKLKLFVFCPYEEKIISNIINAASEAGAGQIEGYTHCAFIIKGQGNWKSPAGSNPAIGKAGEITRTDEVKIGMECPEEKAIAVSEAIRKVHPYEKVKVDFIRLEDI